MSGTIEAQILAERIYLIRKPEEDIDIFYMMKHYDEDNTPAAMFDKFERFLYEA